MDIYVASVIVTEQLKLQAGDLTSEVGSIREAFCCFFEPQ